MKLKTAFQDENFKLGEVADVSMATMPDGRIVARATAKVGGEHTFYYDSLEAVYNDWEDYEEPKEHWCATMYGGITRIKDGEEPIDDLIEIGNYFNSKEDAYDAVEKLKAWKRLRDKGFRFEYYDYSDRDLHNHIQIKAITNREVEDSMLYKEDLDLLFGGEE